MMKRFLTALVAMLSLVLVACQQPTSQSEQTEMGQVQLIVTTPKTKTDEKVTFQAGQTIMDVLKANYDVEETDGFITAIDGVKQDEAKQLYWLFDLNDEMAPKAADQIQVKDGDKIAFYQKSFE